MTGRLIVSDANILIDMEVGGLLRQMFKLDVTFAVPNTLFEEELSAHHPDLQGLGLRSLELHEATVAAVGEMVAKYQRTGVSTNDLLALGLAQQETCPLLTGDAKLRTVAEREKVEFHGTIWLLGELLEKRLISVRQAAAGYDKMKRAGRRLPWEEAESQVARFGKS